MGGRAFLTLPALSSLLLLTFFALTNAGNVMFETVSIPPISRRAIPKASVKAQDKRGIKIVHRTKAHNAAFAKDSLRVAALQKRRRDEPSIPGHDASVYPISGLDVTTSTYLITLQFGNPPEPETMIMDTSSDITWVRCNQTVSESTYSGYDPAFSSTYRNLSCDSSNCIKFPSNTCFNSTNCFFEVGYGEGIYSSGFLASDTIVMPLGERLDDFIFGCGQRSEGFPYYRDGLIGMGRGPYSLNSQLAPRTPNIFSYCLPLEELESGYLQIGSPPYAETEYTPMLTDSRSRSMYFLDLTGITVGGKKLDVSSSVFQSAGTIIDSGTEITRLPPKAYKALKTAFRASMKKYPMAEASTILDTCYDFRNFEEVTYPAILFHFEGLDLKVPAGGVFYSFNCTQHCLSFAGNPNAADVGIIGTLLQRTMAITYDNTRNRIGFAQDACE